MRTRGAMVLPLALAQFVASYAATTMNVAISAIAHDLGTTVIGVQTTITLFTLTMAALMVPGSKLTDIWGRKRCFLIGLVVYGTGALLAAFAPGPGLLLVGYSLLEGVGSALMIPPIYILVTVSFADPVVRARNFGVVSGAGALGAAAGPLLGGLVTSWLGWRASFLLQVAIVVWVIVAARHIVDRPRPRPRPGFDLWGAVLSGAGLFFVVFGVLRTGTYGWGVAREDFTIGEVVLLPAGGLSPVWVFVGIGALVLYGFFRHIRVAREPLCSPSLFRDRTSNLGLGTQTVQWLVMQGAFFVVSVYLQQERGFSAVHTGLVLLPATVGVLAASGVAARMARRNPARRLVIAGFAASAAGLGLLLALVRDDSAALVFAPGLFLLGAGIGTMLTASVNLVQSAWPDELQGDISGVSRAVSNLGSSLGTALAGSVLAGAAAPGGGPFAAALVVLAGFAVLGLVVAALVPRRR
ncbi:MFS transporter [Actinosynnema sp. NPDC047251]|uniref:Permease, MFS-type n=1 Tax=Saccharothrix espanaensis (strain ATCC 51144 / DSM 44229 / JCM 9112 / NBRC 15066 / NRRL 15764) TaxID=1179773 RepID=K0K6M6_SACES|nr:MFS transporter [Saccharothrix espanaensis]CCH33162.1 Permease, MFS-type [Saccharothrix espanaensis DSM 44229]